MHIPEEWPSLRLRTKHRTRLTGHLTHLMPPAGVPRSMRGKRAFVARREPGRLTGARTVCGFGNEPCKPVARAHSRARGREPPASRTRPASPVASMEARGRLLWIRPGRMRITMRSSDHSLRLCPALMSSSISRSQAAASTSSHRARSAARSSSDRLVTAFLISSALTPRLWQTSPAAAQPLRPPASGPPAYSPPAGPPPARPILSSRSGATADGHAPGPG